MKALELVRPETTFKKFRLKNGKIFWKTAHMHGDRRKVCISRKSQGRVFKMYINPHTEVECV